MYIYEQLSNVNIKTLLKKVLKCIIKNKTFFILPSLKIFEYIYTFIEITLCNKTSFYFSKHL